MFPEVAFSSILLIVLVLFPGLVFRRFFYSGKFTKQFVKGEWSERIVTSIFWGVLTQIITLLSIKHIPWIEENYLINGTLEDLYYFNIPSYYKDNNTLIFSLIYIISSIFIAAILGSIFFRIIRFLKLDIKINSLRYSNQWHYIFEGEITRPNEKVLMKWVDLTLSPIQDNGKNKMIKGILVDYSFNATTGELEYLYLEQVQRYSSTNNEFKEILCDIFVIPFSNVVDMNIRYKYKERKSFKKIYRAIISIAIFTLFPFYFAFPWLIATKETSIWRLLFSYIPLTVCLLGLSGFLSGFLSFNKANKTFYWQQFIMLLITFLGWLLVEKILL